MAMVTRQQTYSSREACDLADISYRQLDYWCRIGTITPEVAAKGTGSRRVWSRQQINVLAVLALVGGHVPISSLDELGAMLLDWDGHLWDGTTLLVTRDGVWVAGEDADNLIPPVATAVNLGAIRRQVIERTRRLAR